MEAVLSYLQLCPGQSLCEAVLFRAELMRALLSLLVTLTCSGEERRDCPAGSDLCRAYFIETMAPKVRMPLEQRGRHGQEQAPVHLPN